MSSHTSIFKSWLILAFLCLPVTHSFSAQTSALKGKVIDVNGHGIGGVKVMVRLLPENASEKKSKPTEVTADMLIGYEYFDTTTTSSGTFLFEELLPLSNYVLRLWHRQWKPNVPNIFIKTPSHSKTLELDKPLIVKNPINKNNEGINPYTNEIRLTKNKTGMISDSYAKLQWYEGPDKDTNYDEALFWIENLTVNGGHWRLPKRNELETLCFQGDKSSNVYSHGLPSLFRTTGAWIWSGEAHTPSKAWLFDCHNETWYSIDRNHSNCDRAIAVRKLN